MKNYFMTVLVEETLTEIINNKQKIGNEIMILLDLTNNCH